MMMGFCQSATLADKKIPLVSAGPAPSRDRSGVPGEFVLSKICTHSHPVAAAIIRGVQRKRRRMGRPERVGVSPPVRMKDAAVTQLAPLVATTEEEFTTPPVHML